jgi:Ca2+-binding RTX toxin-like protein
MGGRCTPTPRGPRPHNDKTEHDVHTRSFTWPTRACGGDRCRRLLVATLGLAAAATSAAQARVHARVQAGTLAITGTARADTIGLRLAPGVPTTLQVDVGGDGTADFSFETATFTAITVHARRGADTITGSAGLAELGRLTIHGGRGNDSLLGGDGDDVLLGGRGDDTVNGARGNDTGLLGAGDDRFTWNPGDGDDTVEGQAGNDVLAFNGSNAAERIDVAANGSRVRLFRNVANITMDFDAVERLELNAVGGADAIFVNDLTGTDLETVDIDLSASAGGGDAQAHTVITTGTSRPDRVRVTRSGTRVLTTGLAARTRIAGSEAANDRLQINTLAGNDDVNVATDVADLIRPTVNLGADD